MPHIRCPFCGSNENEIRVEENASIVETAVVCMNCRARGPGFIFTGDIEEDKKRAQDAWDAISIDFVAAIVSGAAPAIQFAERERCVFAARECKGGLDHRPTSIEPEYVQIITENIVSAMRAPAKKG